MKKPQSSSIFDDSDYPMCFVRKSIFQGTGVDLTEAGKRPIIGIANSLTDINPGHMHLGMIAQRVKDGVNAAGGLPFEFNVPAPCDGMTEGHAGMRFVLAQRDLIADIIETHARSMRYDGIVFIASCDKIIPGMIMAAARLDLPAIFVTGGPNAWDIRFKPSMSGAVDHKCYTDLLDKLAYGGDVRLVRSDGHCQYHAIPHGSPGYQPGGFGNCPGLSFRQTTLRPPCRSAYRGPG